MQLRELTAPASEYLPVRQPPCVTTPGTQRRHGAAGISEMKLCETHSTSDDASTAARLLTCLARRANERTHSADLRRVFACQTATKRHRTRHAASIRAHATMRIGCLPTARSFRTKPGSHSKASRCPPAFPASPAAHSVQLPTPGPALCLPVPAQTDAHGQDTITPPS